MKEYSDNFLAIDQLFKELFGFKLNDMQKELPLLKCITLITPIQLIVFFAKLSEKFEISKEDIKLFISSNPQFTYIDLINLIM